MSTRSTTLTLCRVQALQSFDSSEPSTLKFATGDYIDVVSKLSSGWWNGWCNGSRGWFPSSFVKSVEVDSDTNILDPPGTDDTSDKRSSQQSGTLFDDRIGHSEPDERFYMKGGRPVTDTSSSSSSRSSAVYTATDSINDTRRSLPADWVFQQEEDGSIGYYINIQTGEMRYSFPQDESSLSIYDTQGSDAGDEEDSLTLPRTSNKSLFQSCSEDFRRRSRQDFRSSSVSSASSLNNDARSRDNYNRQHGSKCVKRTTDQGLPFFSNMAIKESAWHADEKRQRSIETDDLNGSIDSKRSSIATSLNSTSINGSSNSDNSKNNGTVDADEIPGLLSPMSIFSPVDHELRHQRQQRLTWKKLLTHITSIINQLSTAIKNSHSTLYRTYADRVVDAIRFMLLASRTISKESINFRSNNVLRSHHRAMMASMTKLVIAARLSSADKRLPQSSASNHLNINTNNAATSESTARAFNTADQITLPSASSADVGMLSQGCHELTAAVRNYVNTCESIPVEVHYVDPTFVLTGDNEEDDSEWDHILKRRKDSISSGTATMSVASSGANASGYNSEYMHCPNNSSYDVGGLRAKYELEANLLENLEAYGASMQESMEPLLANLAQQSDSRCSLAVLLFTHYRNFGNQNGQFLSIIEDTDFEDVLHVPALRALDEAKQQLYDGLGILFTKMQMMTDEIVPLEQAITDMQQVSIKIIDAIKSVCSTMAELVNERSRILKTRQEQEQQQQLEQSQTIEIENGQSVFGNSVGALRTDERKGNEIAETEDDDADLFARFLRNTVGINETSLDLDFKLPPLLDEHQPYNACKRSKSVTSEVQHKQDGIRTTAHRASAPASNRSSLSITAQRPRQAAAPAATKNTSAKLKQFFGDDLPSEASISLLATATPTSRPSDEPAESAKRKLSMTPSSSATRTSDTVVSEDKPNLENSDIWYLRHDYKPSEIVFTVDGTVKGGTLRALVERMTMHDYLDMNFNSTFLLTYRSFSTSIELLALLEARYNIQPPEGLKPEELEIWTNRKQKLVRLRVFNVLKSWLEQYYYEEDSVLLDRLLFFTNTSIRESLRFSAVQLERLIHKRKDARTDLKKLVVTQQQDMPEPIVPRDMRNLRLLDVDPLEMARQLTLLDFKMFSSIKPIECLDKAWSRDTTTITIAYSLLSDDSAFMDKDSSRRLSDQQQRPLSSPQTHPTAINIRTSIEYCNRLTTWVTDAILSQPEVKKRSIIIKYWVQVAERCRLFNNFNTCMAILSAFDNSAIGRLKRTWELVGARTNHVLSHIRKLMGANRNFNQYRALLHSVNPPCIPFLGIYLQDLTFIEDGNSNFLKTSKDLINFAKRAKTAEVIREIQQYQTTGYYLRDVREIQKFIISSLRSARDEEILYKESLKIEPREREDEKITRLLQESGFL